MATVDLPEQGKDAVEASIKLVELASDDPSCRLVRIEGEIDLASVDTLRAALEPILAEAPPRLAIDMSGVRFMDSTGIALMLSVSERTGHLELRQPEPVIRRVIDLTGLSDVFHVAT